MKPRLVYVALAGALALGGIAASGSTASADIRHDRPLLRTSFLRLDVNHDGMLSRWEVSHANYRMQNRLWRADLNRDGWITRYEMRATYGIPLAAPPPVVIQPQPIVRPRPLPPPTWRPRAPRYQQRPVYNPPRVRDHRRDTPAPRYRDRDRDRRDDRRGDRRDRRGRDRR